MASSAIGIGTSGAINSLPLVSLVRRTLPGVPTVYLEGIASRLIVVDNYKAIRFASQEYDLAKRYSTILGTNVRMNFELRKTQERSNSCGLRSNASQVVQ